MPLEYKLSTRERRFVNWNLTLSVFGGFAMLVLLNATGHWWPFALLIGLLALSWLCLFARIARRENVPLWKMLRMAVRTTRIQD